MGSSQEKRKRSRITEEDFAILEAMTKELMSALVQTLGAESIQVGTWPHRFQYKRNNFAYELIFSQMGSFTLRPMAEAGFRRNPPPIYYISLGKYEEGLIWEDLVGTPVTVELEELGQAVRSCIENFEKFSS
jgi:hypothetical protein